MKKVKYLFLIVAGLFLTFSCNQKQNKNELSKKLNVYNWSYYIGETTISDFEKETEVKVNYDNYSSNEEMLAKLQAGARGYDIIFPSDYMVQIMIEQNMLEQINLEKIQNFKNIYNRFKGLPFDPENKYSIPYQWGTTGIGINTKFVTENIESWDILWDDNYKGRISILNDMRFGLVPALKKLGYSINTTNQSELDEAKELMIKQKPLVKAYSSDTYIDMLKSGEVWIAYGFSGDIYQVAKENPDVIYIIPKEGTNIWVDNMCIPKGAPHKYTAEFFINYILEPEVSAGISNYTWYSSPNQVAFEYIDKKIKSAPNIYPTDEVLNRSEFLIDVGESTRLYDRIWNEIKAN